MCGIAGFFSSRAEGPVIEAMALAQRHRGPDEQRWCSPIPSVWLGHARLKVIDLSPRGAQPMKSMNTGSWLVYNGEIYNYLHLRRLMEMDGRVFTSDSDTEVLLAAWERWGQGCLERLDGMFAFVLWDHPSKRFFLARDRAGKKPLYYLRSKGEFAFASETRALRHFPGADSGPDLEELPSLFAFGYPRSGKTSWKNIRQLLPGHYAFYQPMQDKWEEKAFWKASWQSVGHVPPYQSSVRLLRKILEEAVQKRMEADVPLGAFLSGGIDSTVVTGIMSRLRRGTKIKTFSIGFSDQPAFDESGYAAEAAQFHQTEHRLFQLPAPAFGMVEKLVEHYDCPFADSSAIPTYLVSERARQHVTVVLTGDGGDELFAGYRRMALALGCEKIPLWARRCLQEWLKPRWLERFSSTSCSRTVMSQWRRFAKAASMPLPSRYLRWASVWADFEDVLRPEFCFPKQLAEIEPSFQSIWSPTNKKTDFAKIMETNFHEYLPNDLLVKVDRCTMAHGLEARCPLLDQALSEFAMQLPATYQLKGLQGKRILRDACRDLLPAGISKRGKMGFGVPLGAWFRGPWKADVEQLLFDSQAKIHEICQRSRVQEILRSHLGGSEDFGHKIWLLVTLEIWLQRHSRSRLA